MGLEEIFRELTTKDVAVNDESEGSGEEVPESSQEGASEEVSTENAEAEENEQEQENGRNRTVLRPRKRRLRNNVGCL